LYESRRSKIVPLGASIDEMPVPFVATSPSAVAAMRKRRFG
jgi:hypothetical protein